MDYCVELLLNNLNTGQEEGVVVGVFPAKTQGTLDNGTWLHNDLITSPRTVLVYVTGVPEKVNLKERLLEPDVDDSDPDNEKDHRKYDCRFAQAFKTALARDKLGQIAWVDLPVYDRVNKRQKDKRELEDEDPLLPELPLRGVGRRRG